MHYQQLFKTWESLISGNFHLVVWVAVGHGWLKLWKVELGSREAPSTAKSKGKWETETETQTNSSAGVLSCLSASFTAHLRGLTQFFGCWWTSIEDVWGGWSHSNRLATESCRPTVTRADFILLGVILLRTSTFLFLHLGWLWILETGGSPKAPHQVVTGWGPCDAAEAGGSISLEGSL